MALPKLDVPTYDLKIPSTGEVIQYRPFLVKEEKILLMALQDNDPNDIARAIKQIITNCILTESFDIDKIKIYDLEYIFLKLRIHSIGENAVIQFAPRDENITKCEECLKVREVEINLNDADIVYNEEHKDTFELSPGVGIKMKYPDFKIIKQIQKAKDDDNIETLFNVFWYCIESIYEGDEHTSTKNIPLEEGIQWLETLNTSQFAKIEKFFETMPKLKQNIKISCKSCDFEQDYELVGLDSFFA